MVKTHRAAAGPGNAYNPFDAAQAAAQAAEMDAPPPHPLRKDTVYVPARGYVVLRFALDNEGLWLLHCHVLWHQAIGMGIVVQVGRGASADAMERAGRGCLPTGTSRVTRHGVRGHGRGNARPRDSSGPDGIWASSGVA